MEPHFRSALQQRLDDAGPQPPVGLAREPVVRMRVLRHQEERRRGAGAPLVVEDALEAPVGVCPAHEVQRHPGQGAGLAQSRPATQAEDLMLQPGGAPAHAEASPLPGRVDVVGEGYREARPSPARRLELQLAAETLDGRVERVERRRRSAEAVVLVAPSVALLDPREVEERLGQVVAGRPLAALDLLPGLGLVLHIVSEAHLAAADRVQHPAGPPFHLLRDQRKAPLTIREASTSPGLRSSLVKTASMYGPFGTAGRSPGMSEIAQRRCSPFIEAGTTSSPVRSR